MNTIAKTGTATTALLLALLAGACGAEDATRADEHTTVVPGAEWAGATDSRGPAGGESIGRHPRKCRMSPDAVERWTRAGEPEMPCLVDGYESTHHYGDDRRQPVR
jgi:hypothetical protein